MRHITSLTTIGLTVLLAACGKNLSVDIPRDSSITVKHYASGKTFVVASESARARELQNWLAANRCCWIRIYAPPKEEGVHFSSGKFQAHFLINSVRLKAPDGEYQKEGSTQGLAFLSEPLQAEK
jgi:hypothetical protein